MYTYHFVLTYRLGRAQDADAAIDALGAAGFTDCLVGVGVPGHVALAGARPGASATAALVALLADVQHALPDAEFVRCATACGLAAGHTPQGYSALVTLAVNAQIRQIARARFGAEGGGAETACAIMAELVDWLRAQGLLA